MFDGKGTFGKVGVCDGTLDTFPGCFFTRRRELRRSEEGALLLFRSTDWDRLKAFLHDDVGRSCCASGYGRASIGKPMVVTGGWDLSSSVTTTLWGRLEVKENLLERLGCESSAIVGLQKQPSEEQEVDGRRRNSQASKIDK